MSSWGSQPLHNTKTNSLLQWKTATADSCIKQCHPLTVELLQTHSLVVTVCWRLGVCRGNNNLKGPPLLLLLLLCFLLCTLCMSVSPSLPPCWVLSVVLVNVLLSCLDVIYATGSDVDLSPYLSPVLVPSPSPPSSSPPPYRDLAPSVSASLAPLTETGRSFFPVCVCVWGGVSGGVKEKFPPKQPPVT